MMLPMNEKEAQLLEGVLHALYKTFKHDEGMNIGTARASNLSNDDLQTLIALHDRITESDMWAKSAREVKEEALKNAMCFTEEQHQAFIKLRNVISECTDKGLEFAFDGDVVRVFRADLLKDVTTNMVPMDGQIPVPQEMLYTCIQDLHNAPDGLYANVK